MKYILIISCIPFLLAHCKSPTDTQISNEDKEILELFKKIQIEKKLTNEEMMQAVKRYCSESRTVESSVDEEVPMIKDFATMPAQLKELRGENHTRNYHTSRICLAVLKSYKENKTESCHAASRELISLYYNSIRNRNEEIYINFRKDVEDYALDDKELTELLNK